MARFSLLIASALFLFGREAVAAKNYTSGLLSSGYISLGEWQEAYDKAVDFVNGLTTDDKVSIITAGGAGNFTALLYKDSASAVLDEYFVTTWPAPLALAHTWNRSLVYEQSGALAKEHRARGINVITAPTSQPLGRCAWGGRNGETFGPDNYLNGQLTGRMARGILDQGVGSGGKHFILNEQETNRKGTANTVGQSSHYSTLEESYSANVDDKTLHETYAWTFYDAIKNGMQGVMCAMNQVNGSYACENDDLLMGTLKSEIGFPGLVYGDVGGQHTASGSWHGGLDYEDNSFGGSYWTSSWIEGSLSNGSITMDELDDKVIRNVIGWFRTGQDHDYPAQAANGDYLTPDPRDGHAALSRRYAAESMVLLKNEGGALPLNTTRKVAIFGWHAGFAYAGPNTPMDVSGLEPSVFRGHMAQVGGSGQGSFSYLATPVFAFTQRAMDTGMMLRFQLNDSVITADDENNGAAPASQDSTAIARTTASMAYNQDACLVFLNAYAGEGMDRAELSNDDQDTLVTTVAANCNNTIVIVNSNGPRVLDGFVDHANVTAVLYGGALGQESGNAILDVLYGAVNPSAKLAHTIARSAADYAPFNVSQAQNIDFTEGNYIDWKYFDKYNMTPRYEFGHGLSYTTFSLSDLAVTANTTLTASYATGARSVGGRTDLWDTVATVTATVENTGARSGAEVAQLYVGFPAAAHMPARNLRGFDKVRVAAGARAPVSFALQRRDLSHWDAAAREWKLEAGTYTLYLGSSSRDIRAQTSLVVS